MNVIFTKYNNRRLPEFQLETTIYEINGQRKVRKRSLSDLGRVHLNNIYLNSQKTSELYKGIKVLVPEIYNNELHYPFITGNRWSDILLELIKSNNKNDFIQKIKYFANKLIGIQSESSGRFISNEEFEKVFGCELVLEDTLCLNPANIDMTFDNIIESETDSILIDCEWVFNFEVPASFVLYRSMYSFWTKHQFQIRPFFEIEDFYSIVGIDGRILEFYVNMEKKFQDYVHGQYSLENYKKKTYLTSNIVKLIEEKKYYSYAYLPINGVYKSVKETEVNGFNDNVIFEFLDPCEDHVRFDVIRKPALIEIKSLKITDPIDDKKIYEQCDGTNEFEGLTFSNDVRVLSKENSLTLILLTDHTHLFLKLNLPVYNGLKLILDIKLIHLIEENLIKKIEQLEDDTDYLELKRVHSDLIQKNNLDLQHYEKENTKLETQIINCEKENIKLETQIIDYENEITIFKMNWEEQSNALIKKEKELNEILESKSWKLTEPLRKIMRIFNVKEWKKL